MSEERCDEEIRQARNILQLRSRTFFN